MSTIPSASSTVAASAAQTATAAAAAQSIISGSTGNSSLDVSSLVTSLVNAKVAGQTVTLSAQQTNDNTKLSAIGALQAALSALQANVLPLSNGTTLGQFTATAEGTGLTATATSDATAGVYSIGVTQIASAQTLSSAAFGAATALGTGTDGAHLVLRSSATGASNTISVGVTGVERCRPIQPRRHVHARHQRSRVDLHVSGEHKRVDANRVRTRRHVHRRRHGGHQFQQLGDHRGPGPDAQPDRCGH